jgi:hypothetical protein
MKTRIALLMLIISPICSKAQEDEYRGFSFGLRIGAYSASDTTANFYNGSGVLQSGTNYAGVRAMSIAERINWNPLETQYINSYYGSSGFSFPNYYDNYAYPTAMRYSPAIALGLDLRYRLDRYSSFVFQFLTTRIKTVDKYSVIFEGTGAQQNAQQDIRLFTIEGNEQRFQMVLGYRQGWEINDGMDFFIQPGISLTGIKVVNNKAYIADRSYDLFIGGDNFNQTYGYVPRTATGMGAGLQVGFEFPLGAGHSADISFGLYREKMKLWDWETNGWNKTVTASFYY